ncbi:MAG: class I SAM-dependent methyltransferase, partial [Balneolaceae bacterium]
AQELDVPYYVTEPEVVEGMLDMAGVGPGDYLIDLGSGDGRIVIAAAQRGAVGHGVDLDPRRNVEANRNAREAGVDDRVVFLEEDLFETDFSQATVVTMFLLSSINLRLRPDLLSRLRPGTRVLSHTFDMGEWEPDLRQVIGIRPVYLWVIPAQVDGVWEWTSDGAPFSMTIEQQFQHIAVSLYAGEQKLNIETSKIKGDRITLIASGSEGNSNSKDNSNNGSEGDTTSKDNGIRYLFSGKVEEDRITGFFHNRRNDVPAVKIWSAIRIH